jgi:phytoene desaturase
MSSHPAIIIGSGVGGLATAIRLALKGHDVTVLERRPSPGGKLSLMEVGGYRFDRGPSLFTEPGNIAELFMLAGVPMLDHFRYRRVEESCRYHFNDGKVVAAAHGVEAFARALREVTGEEEDNVNEYLKKASSAYSTLGDVFLRYSLHKASTWLNRRILGALWHTRPAYLFKSLDAYNRVSFRTPEARMIFDRFATYNGSDPYRAPAMLSMIPHLEMGQGTWYPEGGMWSITEALYRLARESGVTFRFDAPVSRILHEKGRVTGVNVQGEILPAPIVVSNADVLFTYRDLLGDQRMARKLERQERSSSAVIFYWGVGRAFPELALHNIFFSGDYQDEFKRIFSGPGLSADPTVYVNITARMEEGHAPPGKENWFVMVNAPAGMSTDDPTLIDNLRNNVLDKLERMLGAPIRPHLEVERVLTPKGIEADTSTFLGALYGTSSNTPFSAFLRHPNFSRSIRGLYFAGGSVHPGGGIPLCLKSAAIVAGMIPDAASGKS